MTHKFRNVLWSKSYCLVVVFILEKDSQRVEIDRNKSQNEDINSCVYALIQYLNNLLLKHPFCHDLEVMSSKPGRVELVVRGTSVLLI